MTIKWTSSFTGLTENFEKEKLKNKNFSKYTNMQTYVRGKGFLEFRFTCMRNYLFSLSYWFLSEVKGLWVLALGDVA